MCGEVWVGEGEVVEGGDGGVGEWWRKGEVLGVCVGEGKEGEEGEEAAQRSATQSQAHPPRSHQAFLRSDFFSST